MEDYVIIHITVNINNKNESFLYTFNPKSFEKTKSKRGLYLSNIRKRTMNLFNKKYHLINMDELSKVDTSTTKSYKDSDTHEKSSDIKYKVKKYAERIMNERYEPGQYLNIPPVKRAFKVSNIVVKNISKMNKNKILYGSETPLIKLLKKDIGNVFFENLKTKQYIYVVDVTFFVDHSNRTLHDKFNEFCSRNKSNLNDNLHKFSTRKMRGSSRSKLIKKRKKTLKKRKKITKK